MSRYKQLFTEINRYKPTSIIEIGTWNGNHAVQMINQIKKYAPKEQIIYYGFDLFEDFKAHEEECCPKKPAKREDVAKKLLTTGISFRLIKGNTRQTLADPTICKDIPSVDFIFIDGGHSKETIASDWKNVQRFISSRTVIIFDDYYPDRYDFGCHSLINDLEQDENWLVWHLPIVDKVNGFTIKMIKVMRSFL